MYDRKRGELCKEECLAHSKDFNSFFMERADEASSEMENIKVKSDKADRLRVFVEEVNSHGKKLLDLE